MLLEIAKGAFKLIRVALYIILTATAWLNIIEENKSQQWSRQKKRRVKKCSGGGNKKGWQQTDEGGQPLTESALAQHDKSMSSEDNNKEEEKHTPLRATAYTDLDMDPEESIEDWSLWNEQGAGGDGENSDEGEDEAQQQVPGSSSNKKSGSKKRQQTNTDANSGFAFVDAAETGQVTVGSLTGNALTPTSHNQQVAAVAAEAEDKDEADVLAVTTAPVLTNPPKYSGWKKDKQGRVKKRKQPLITRMMDKYFYKPFLGKYERLGYMMYKGFNKTGMRIERGMHCIAENMNGAIRDAGVEAVHSAEEFVLRKYLKFFVVWVVLTAVLLPLPSISLSVQVGQ